MYGHLGCAWTSARGYVRAWPAFPSGPKTDLLCGRSGTKQTVIHYFRCTHNAQSLHYPERRGLSSSGSFFEFGNGHASLISQGSGEDGFVSHFTGSKTLQHFAWLGFQNYLADNATLETIGTRFFESLRLGEFRNNPRSAEPLLRDASVHFVDLKAVRHSDAPDGLGMSPNGLYAEEICTLGRYIGLSTRFRLSVIYGYPSSANNNSLVSKLVAQVIWHITEGLAVSFPEYPEKDPSRFQRKVVQLGDGGQEMVFLQSRQSGRWWIEVPNLKELSSPMLISCSIDDYKTACRGEIPLKWLFFYQKSNNFS
jgi:hypothetical protein